MEERRSEKQEARSKKQEAKKERREANEAKRSDAEFITLSSPRKRGPITPGL
jgi:hypothetical protein